MKKNNKKKRLITLSIVLTIFAVSVLVASLGFFGNKNNPVIAKVDGQKIYKLEIDNKLSTMFSDGGVP